MRLLSIFLLSAIFHVGYAAVGDGPGKEVEGYPVSDIPEELLENSDAVIREHSYEVEVVSTQRTLIRIKSVHTILNKKADYLGYVVSTYDKMRHITKMSARVYDKNGNEIVKLKKSDISDESSISGFSLYEDDRVKYADLRQKSYPYTIVSEYEMTFDFLFVIPDYTVQQYENVSVQNSAYTLISDPKLTPRFKELNFDNNHRKDTNEGGKDVIRWTFANLPSVEAEPYGLSVSDKSPRVLLGPNEFSYGGYSGSMSTWDDYGKWQIELNEGRNTLSEETKAKLVKMTAGMTQREKTEAIYKYMQNRTRYVSIQLGIGGFQPFKSGLVDEVGYGDCKALSFYTKSMLEAVGVDANYTLIYADEDEVPLYEDFPVNSFNHVILAVPMETDTIWLECTSQIRPFNFLGSQTDARQVLMITDNGAEIVNTPTYRSDQNRQIRAAQVTLNEEGFAEASIETHYTGLQTEQGGLSYYRTVGQKDQKDWVYKTTRIPHYELQSVDMSAGSEDVPFVNVSMKLQLPKFTSQSGKRVFFQPNLMNQWKNPLHKHEDRKDPISFSHGFTDVDSIVYQFPSNLRMEYVPEEVFIENEFGSYRSKMEFIQGQLIYVRRLEMKGGEYPAEEYETIRQFFNRISREDKKKVVLLKGT